MSFGYAALSAVSPRMRMAAAVLSHVAFLALVAGLHAPLGPTVAVLSFIPAVITAYLLGLRAGLLSSAAIIFAEVPIVASLEGMGYIEGLAHPQNVPGVLAILAISAAVGHLHDLRTELAAQRELAEEKRAVMRTLVDTIPSPVFYKDTQGRYRDCNEMFAERILGIPRERILGASVFDLSDVIPRDLAEKYHAADAALLAAGGVQVYQAAVQCADGVRRTYQFSKAVIGDSGGIVGVMQDISDILQYQVDLENKNLEIKSFTDAVCHDIKKPLTVMETVCALIATEGVADLSADGHEALATGKDAMDFMKEMLADLQECTRLESGGHAYAPETMSLQQAVQSVLQKARYRIEQEKISVMTRGCDRMIIADKMLLTRILLNCIDNAISYMGDGPGKIIEVTCESAKDGVRIGIHDNGVGIPAEERELVFEKFKRGVSSNGRAGTGLGLAIVKAAVEMHGGRVWLESEPGRGTSVMFTLPHRTPAISANTSDTRPA
jgi:PAS domain S-box-containing protein